MKRCHSGTAMDLILMVANCVRRMTGIEIERFVEKAKLDF